MNNYWNMKKSCQSSRIIYYGLLIKVLTPKDWIIYIPNRLVIIVKSYIYTTGKAISYIKLIIK